MNYVSDSPERRLASGCLQPCYRWVSRSSGESETTRSLIRSSRIASSVRSIPLRKADTRLVKGLSFRYHRIWGSVHTKKLMKTQVSMSQTPSGSPSLMDSTIPLLQLRRYSSSMDLGYLESTTQTYVHLHEEISVVEVRCVAVEIGGVKVPILLERKDIVASG